MLFFSSENLDGIRIKSYSSQLGDAAAGIQPSRVGTLPLDEEPRNLVDIYMYLE